MARATASRSALPPSCRALLVGVGRDLGIARKRRRISLRDMAVRMGVSVGTVQRLERGDPGVGVGVMTVALFVLQLHERLGRLIPPDSDAAGRALEIERLPKRVRQRQRPDLDF